MLLEYSAQIIEFIFIVAGIFILFKFVDIFRKKIEDKIEAGQRDERLSDFLPVIDRGLKVIIIFIAIITVLKDFGYSITSLLVVFVITILLIGFGAKGIFLDLLASFAILTDKIYNIGDYIVIDEFIQNQIIEGTVEDINLRSTKIKTPDGALIIVPNNIIAKGIVKNISAKEK